MPRGELLVTRVVIEDDGLAHPFWQAARSLALLIWARDC